MINQTPNSGNNASKPGFEIDAVTWTYGDKPVRIGIGHVNQAGMHPLLVLYDIAAQTGAEPDNIDLVEGYDGFRIRSANNLGKASVDMASKMNATEPNPGQKPTLL